MVASDNWFSRQFVEQMKEASKSYERFKNTCEIEDLDNAEKIYRECSDAYDLKTITFEEFIDFGKSLRARQAL